MNTKQAARSAKNPRKAKAASAPATIAEGALFGPDKVPAIKFDPDRVAHSADERCAVRDWHSISRVGKDDSHGFTLPQCLERLGHDVTPADCARILALLFIEQRPAWRQLLARLAADGVQPQAGDLAQALALSTTVVRRQVLHFDKAAPLRAQFTIPLPGLSAAYEWDLRNASIALAMVIWNNRERIEIGEEFLGITNAERAELAEGVMIAELVLNSEGLSTADGEDLPPRTATKTQRIAWHRLTTVAGLGNAN